MPPLLQPATKNPPEQKLGLPHPWAAYVMGAEASRIPSYREDDATELH